MKNKLLFIFLALLAFTEGGIVIGTEVLWAKFIGQVNGQSVYVWASTLGISLFGLALGYLIGGWLSLSTKFKFLGITGALLTASICLILIPSAGLFLVKEAMFLDGAFLKIITPTALILMPLMVALGIISPLLVGRVAKKFKKAGYAAGTVYMVSTAGGALFAPLLIYFLIPELGLKFNFLLFGSLLFLFFICSFLFMKQTDQVWEEESQIPLQFPNIFSLFKTQLNRNYKWLILAFFEGACILAVEFLGMRIIAAFYGSSFIAFVSVLSITIVSLTGGYFIGGYLSKFSNYHDFLYYILFTCAFLIGLIPVIGETILMYSYNFGFDIGLWMASFLLVTPSLTMLGTISALLIEKITEEVRYSGNSSGLIYALSSIGGICSSLILGFWVVPAWGISGPLMFFSFVMIFISPFLFQMIQRRVIVMIIFTFIFFIQSGVVFFTGKPETSKFKVLYQSEGMLGQLRVLDEFIDGSYNDARRLLLNNIPQTIVLKDPGMVSSWDYPHVIGSYFAVLDAPRNALVMGLGGGAILKELVQHKIKTDVVDIDPRMQFVAEKYFGVDPNSMNFVVSDARNFFETSRNKYDIIIIDLLNGEEQPSHLFTIESFLTIKKRLSSEGIVIINFQGYTRGVDGLGFRSIYKTLEYSGFKVNYRSGSDTLCTDITLIASEGIIDFSKMSVEKLNPCCRIVPEFDQIIVNAVSKVKVNTDEAHLLKDDKPILEHLNKRANMEWRNSIIQVVPLDIYSKNKIDLFR
jgi:predicted membrane-bound spermidine synthase